MVKRMSPESFKRRANLRECHCHVRLDRRLLRCDFLVMEYAGCTKVACQCRKHRLRCAHANNQLASARSTRVAHR